jgi:hypothetical protein
MANIRNVDIVASMEDSFPPNAVVKLSVPPVPDVSYSWEGPGIEIKNRSEAVVRLPSSGEFEFSVTGSKDGQPLFQGLRVLAIQEPVDPDQSLRFDPWFASLMGLTTVWIGWFVLKPVFSTIRSLAELSKTDSVNLRPIVGGLVALGLLLIGIVVILGGLFAGLMEVRGRMVQRELSARHNARLVGQSIKWNEVIDSIGKLKGAALLLVVGCVPLLAAAWIGKTALEVPGSKESPGVVATTVAPSDKEDGPPSPSTSTTTEAPQNSPEVTETLPPLGEAAR